MKYRIVKQYPDKDIYHIEAKDLFFWVWCHTTYSEEEARSHLEHIKRGTMKTIIYEDK